MNAVIFQCYQSLFINGAIIDAFEYFISILENGGSIKLVLVNGSDNHVEFFKSIFDDKYELSDLNYTDHIINMSTYGDLIKHRFNKVLVVDWGTIKHTLSFLSAKYLIVLSDGNTDNPLCMYNKKLYNVTYYGEMPFVYKDVNYRMKFLFNRFKSINTSCEGIYINSPGYLDDKFIGKLNLPDKPIIMKSSLQHLNNMFELFDTYVYYHGGNVFDLRSRLFHECLYYNKYIIYINNTGVKDGSYYRYNDVIENGLSNRILDANDEVIQLFL